MEIWNKGRDDLLEQLTEVYDRIGRNISTELNNENYIRISREEVRLLRENSALADKLAEHNARLQDELERCRAASARVEGLERENQRLSGELEQVLKQRTQVHNAVTLGLTKSTPHPSSELSSSGESEPVARTGVSREKHQELIAKYNAVCVNYKSMKEAKSKLEGIRDADKVKFRKWNAFKEEQDARIGKKDERILRLKEEIQRLRLQLTDFAGELEPPAADETEMVLQFDPNDIQTPEINHVAAGVRGGTSDIENREGDPSLPDHRDDLDLHLGIIETQFEVIERCQSSSTDGSDPIEREHPDAEENIIKQESLEVTHSSPNSVVFVSSKSTKKNKGRGKSDDTRSAIKFEHLESSPIGLAAMQNMNDSMDLDDIGEKVNTPRKRKRALESSRRISSLASSPISTRNRSQSHDRNISTEDTGPILPLEATPAVRKSSVLQPRSINTPILPRTSAERSRKKRRILDEQAVASLLEDGELVALKNSVEQQIQPQLGNLLTTPSPQKEMLTRTRLITPANQARSARATAPSMLANEIEREASPIKGYIAPCLPATGLKKRRNGSELELSPKKPITPIAQLVRSSSRGNTRVSAEPVRPSSRGKPNFSINSLGPMSRDLSPFGGPSVKSTEPLRLTEFFKNMEANMTPSNNTSSPFSKSPSRTSHQGLAGPSGPPSHQTAQSSSTRNSRLNGDLNDEPDVNPVQKHLRLRPMQSLTLQDFKINPNYNQGYKYAFSEVVRGKDARKCIQGCTKPGCCGLKFRALVEGMRDPNKPLTASQEEADTILLDEYLGRDAYKVQNMNKEERDEMILQAKTRDYANKHGKHRHAFERPSSPPGFWRADMPSTQEEIADRAMAREKDRNTIEERYREAMRKGGRYMFRDE